MLKFNKILILVSLGIFITFSLNIAQAESLDKSLASKPQVWPSFEITGQVLDGSTKEPMVGAEVSFGKDKVVTDEFGNYSIFRYTSSKFIISKVTVFMSGYQPVSKLIYFTPWVRSRFAQIDMYDTTPPLLTIITPSEGGEIFTTPTIEIHYTDLGSGIDQTTVKILANGRDITEYITEINKQKAVCVIPVEAPLGIGSCIIHARVRDRVGNEGFKNVSVIVISQVDRLISKGKEALLNRDINSAHQYFAQALDVDASNPEANFYYAMTRLAILPQTNEAIFNLFVNMGFTGTGPDGALIPADLNPFNFTAQPPDGLEAFDLADTFPNSDAFVVLIKDVIIPELSGSLENLLLAPQDFVSYLDINNPFTSTETIEIDYGDVAILKSIIYALKAKMHAMLVYDTDSLDLAYLGSQFTFGDLTPRYILETYTNLLHIEEGEFSGLEESILSRAMLVSAIDNYIEGFNFIENEADPQYDDLLSIAHAPEYLEQARFFNEQISDIRKSLVSQPDAEFSMKFSQLINLGSLFEDPLDFRRMLGSESEPGGVRYILDRFFLAPVDYTLANFSKADVSYQENLPPDNPFYTTEVKDVDFVDILGLKLSLESVRASVFSKLAYNLDLNGQEILWGPLEGRSFSINNLLNDHPNLFKLEDTTSIDSAKNAFLNIIANYTDTVDYFRDEQVQDLDQTDDILVLSDYFLANEERYRQMLYLLRDMQRTAIDPELEVTGDEFDLDLGKFFNDYIDSRDAREFLPQFDEHSHVIPESWPDLTFGGILPPTKDKK